MALKSLLTMWSEMIWAPRLDADPCHWLLIAGGRSRITHLDEALKMNVGKCAVCNDALALVENPTRYYATDWRAIRKWRHKANRSARDHSTEIWSVGDKWEGAKNIPYDQENVITYSRASIAHARTIGTIMLQHVLQGDASAITLLGYDGYDDRARLNKLMANVIRQVIADRVDVRFYWLGKSVLEAA